MAEPEATTQTISTFQLILTSAGVSAIVSGLINFGLDWLRHRRARIQYFEQQILGRKIHECERVWRLVGRLVADMAPLTHGFTSLAPPAYREMNWQQEEDLQAEGGDPQWNYFEAIQRQLSELELAFEENAIVLGPPIMLVWEKFSGELAFLRREAQFDKVTASHAKELMRWCADFPAELADAIEATINRPQALVSYKELRSNRNKAMAEIESRVKAELAQQQK